MVLRLSTVCLLVMLLGGCAHDDSASAAPKKSSLWPLGRKGPEDATASLEYQRLRWETNKSNYSLRARNTDLKRTIAGEIRTTIETAENETKVDISHFTLAPGETKQLLVYPEKYHLTYEVAAFFKE